MLNVGTTLQQRYQVIGTIKAGGMGAIYEVFDLRLRTHFALKEAFVNTLEERTLFADEAQLLARLSHPVLPKVIDHFSERGGEFLVMELVRGDDLETLVEQRGQAFDVQLVLGWADQLLDALEYLHGQTPPVIHRDIKPANLKPLAGGHIKLLDFGIARQIAPGSQTIAAAKAYSLEYSPLEQFGATTHTDARSDIYALGATLYHLLTNKPPAAAPLRVQGQPLPGPGQFNPACSPRLTQVILQALAMRPEHRFQDATAFRNALRSVSLQADPPHRRRGLRGAIGFSGVMLLVALGIVGSRALGQPASTEQAAFASTSRPGITGEAHAGAQTDVVVPSALPSPTEPPLQTPRAPTSTPGPTTVPIAASTAAPVAQAQTNITSLARASASSILPEENLPNLGLVRYEPGNAIDQDLSTSWVEGAVGSGIGEQLALAFPQPVHVQRLSIDVGFDRDERIFAANNRVRRIRLLFSDGSSQTADLLDQRGFQDIRIADVVTTSITIVIDAVYQGEKYDDTCVAELQVWGFVGP